MAIYKLTFQTSYMLLDFGLRLSFALIDYIPNREAAYVKIYTSMFGNLGSGNKLVIMNEII